MEAKLDPAEGPPGVDNQDESGDQGPDDESHVVNAEDPEEDHKSRKDKLWSGITVRLRKFFPETFGDWVSQRNLSEFKIDNPDDRKKAPNHTDLVERLKRGWWTEGDPEKYRRSKSVVDWVRSIAELHPWVDQMVSNKNNTRTSRLFNALELESNDKTWRSSYLVNEIIGVFHNIVTRGKNYGILSVQSSQKQSLPHWKTDWSNLTLISQGIEVFFSLYANDIIRDGSITYKEIQALNEVDFERQLGNWELVNQVSGISACLEGVTDKVRVLERVRIYGHTAADVRKEILRCVAAWATRQSLEFLKKLQAVIHDVASGNDERKRETTKKLKLLALAFRLSTRQKNAAEPREAQEDESEADDE